MVPEKLKPPVNFTVLILFGLILLSLQLMSSATQESSQLSAMYSWLLLVNALGSVVLLGLVGANIYSLTRQLKKREAGSRLTTRMVSLFVVLSLVPAAIVFYFSMQFLHQGIDSWFNVEMDRAMEDALELSQASLDQRMRWHLRQTQQLAEKLADSSATLALEIEHLRELAEASEMTLFSRQGRIVMSSSINPADILPSLPDENTWLQLRRNAEFVALAPIRENELMIRVIVTVNSTRAAISPGIVSGANQNGRFGGFGGICFCTLSGDEFSQGFLETKLLAGFVIGFIDELAGGDLGCLYQHPEYYRTGKRIG